MWLSGALSGNHQTTVIALESEAWFRHDNRRPTVQHGAICLGERKKELGKIRHGVSHGKGHALHDAHKLSALLGNLWSGRRSVMAAYMKNKTTSPGYGTVHACMIVVSKCKICADTTPGQQRMSFDEFLQMNTDTDTDPKTTQPH